MEIKQADVVLCEFYFADLKQSKNRPVYGSLTDSSYKKYHQSFCKYFGCES